MGRHVAVRGSFTIASSVAYSTRIPVAIATSGGYSVPEIIEIVLECLSWELGAGGPGFEWMKSETQWVPRGLAHPFINSKIAIAQPPPGRSEAAYEMAILSNLTDEIHARIWMKTTVLKLLFLSFEPGLPNPCGGPQHSGLSLASRLCPRRRSLDRMKCRKPPRGMFSLLFLTKVRSGGKYAA